ncbi:MAG: hypothetical protein HZB99_03255 [Candidatus Harrisonbacteria bacterium]|nr:hypothetical protein [Candidatus Harrisonbacteria bacterium]
MNKKFVNPPPRNISLAKYDAAHKELIEVFSQFTDVAALYDYGTVHNPGISDLDIFLILKGDLHSSKAEDYLISEKKFPHTYSLPRGTLMVMNVGDFQGVHWFDDQIKLSHFFGDKIILQDIDLEMQRQRFFASIIDWLPERLGALVRLLQKSEIDIVFSLRVLRCYCYTLEKLYKLTKGSQYQEFVNRVLDLRNHWNDGREKELVELIRGGIVLGCKALLDVSDTILKNEEGAVGELSLYPDLRFHFIDNAQLLSAQWILSNLHPSSIVIPVPSTYAPHFSFYSQQPGFLAEQMRRQMNMSLMLQPKSELYRKFLAKKIGLATRAGEFLLRNGFKDGLFRFGFYFKNYLNNF